MGQGYSTIQEVVSKESEHGMILYMLVTFDKYEYPLIVEESLDELAKKCKCTKNAISSAICHSRKNGGKSRFVKVEVDWEGE